MRRFATPLICDTRHDIMARRAAMAKRRKKAMKMAKKAKRRKKRL